MASFSLEDVSTALASVFRENVAAQFNRSSFVDRMFNCDVVRTVAEEEGESVVLPPKRRVDLELGWDVAFANQVAQAAASAPGIVDAYVGNVRLDGDVISVDLTVRPARSIELLSLTLDVGEDVVVRTIAE